MNPRNNQEVFDFVVNALRKQGKKSINEKGHCQYRAPDGCKCSAGHLIPDEDYDPKWEGYAVKPLAYSPNVVTAYFASKGFHLPLVSALQSAHDGNREGLWECYFQDIARRFNLIYTAV